MKIRIVSSVQIQKKQGRGNFDYVKRLDKHMLSTFLFLIVSALKTNAQVFTITAGINETGKILRMDLSLEFKQDLSLDLSLQYGESHEMFLVLSLTEWDTFLFPLCLAEKRISICQFYNFI